MKIYLVGGAVRDHLLGQPVNDRDWVVVGATPQQMQELGYQPVGADFPVFLHPGTHEEHALARTERKSAIGYRGFTFNTSTEVTLEDDLLRRDLTINAIAQSPDGDLIDPYNGRGDLDARILRHVSPAFAEDPLRVLRVARFCAKLAPFGFTIAPETLAFMRELSASEELTSLTPERVFSELRRALSYPDPWPFFATLRDCGALEVLLPEVDRLFGVPQVATYHPEIDTAVHTRLALQQTVAATDNVAVRYACLCHDLGKGTTPADLLPHHYGHEERGAELADGLSRRLRAPNEYRELAVLTARYHSHCHRAMELKPGTLLKLLSAMDALRRGERFEHFLTICEADARGRTGFEQRNYPQADYLRQAVAALTEMDTAGIVAAAQANEQDIGTAIKDARLQRLSVFRKNAS